MLCVQFFLLAGIKFYPGIKFILRHGITQRPFNATHSSSNIYDNAAKVKFLPLFFSILSIGKKPSAIEQNLAGINKQILVICFEI